MRRTALFRMLCAAGAAAALCACGSDDTATSSPPPASDDGTAKPASSSGDVERGTGYQLTVPDPWKEATREFREASKVAVDIAISGPRDDGFTPSLNVLRFEGREGAKLADVAEQGRTEILGLTGGRDPGAFEDSTLDGEPAKAITFDAQQAGKDLRFRQQLVLHRDVLYSLTFTTQASTFARDAPIFEDMLQSWQWR